MPLLALVCIGWVLGGIVDCGGGGGSEELDELDDEDVPLRELLEVEVTGVGEECESGVLWEIEVTGVGEECECGVLFELGDEKPGGTVGGQLGMVGVIGETWVGEGDGGAVAENRC